MFAKSIRARLLGLSGLFFVVLLATVSLASIQIDLIEDLVESLNLKSLPAARILGDIEAELGRLRLAEATSLPNVAGLEPARARQRLRDLETAYSNLALSGEERRMAATLGDALEAYLAKLEHRRTPRRMRPPMRSNATS